jgi:diaminopimelate decarboxylase
LVARVSEVKDVFLPRRRRYIVLDASMMMFVSRGMMPVGHPVVALERSLAEPLAEVLVEVLGRTCVYDSIAEDIRLPEVSAGELVALLHQGAYSETTSTQFGAFPRSAVVLVDDGRADLVKRRELPADVCSRDATHDSLRSAV